MGGLGGGAWERDGLGGGGDGRDRLGGEVLRGCG